MKGLLLFICVGIIVMLLAYPVAAQDQFVKDIIKTGAGYLETTFIGHGTLMFNFDGKIIHVDPWTKLADYHNMPKADMILLTHHHRDHLDTSALEILRTEKTTLVLTQECARTVNGGIVMKNGDVKTVDGLKIEAMPAYNIVHMRSA